MSSAAFAGASESSVGDKIPTTEKEFVTTINGFDKDEIIEQFGEPSKKDDLGIGKEGKTPASIWQYHYLNTDVNGAYYQTTELDFVDDKVVMVVFMNNDGEEISADAVEEEPVVPTPEPEL
ncbi:MAG TPA: hypothetical protein VJB68_09605 [Methylophilaceae bacterium]|nr:hypothetical protein [Methylophilaceae bacterium]